MFAHRCRQEDCGVIRRRRRDRFPDPEVKPVILPLLRQRSFASHQGFQNLHRAQLETDSEVGAVGPFWSRQFSGVSWATGCGSQIGGLRRLLGWRRTLWFRLSPSAAKFAQDLGERPRGKQGPHDNSSLC